jgi:hypothetical protein
MRVLLLNSELALERERGVEKNWGGSSSKLSEIRFFQLMQYFAKTKKFVSLREG